METQHWLASAVDCGYASPEQVAPLLEQCAEVGRLLGGIVGKAALFCKPGALSVHEQQALYFVPVADPDPADGPLMTEH